MATVKRNNVAPTHLSVWAGLALASLGLIVALISYTGPRVYDLRFAFVALAGGILALGGILTAAWGRSIMASRAQRARRGLTTTSRSQGASSSDTTERTSAAMARPPPTVAVQEEKPKPKAQKGVFAFGRGGKKAAPQQTAPGGLFAFKRSEEPSDAPASSAATSAAHPNDSPSVTSPPADASDAADAAHGSAGSAGSAGSDAAITRITLGCPDCAHQFTAEGTRPFEAKCPKCGFAATV